MFSFDEIEGCKHWSDLLLAGEDESNQNEVEARKDSIKPEDLATIIYTSGTTGRPKGVMLSHHNIVSNVLDSAPRIPFDPGKSTALSFLPICHIFERMILYIYQYYSVSVYFAESIEKLTDNLKEVHPNVMTVVPRLLEKVYDSIHAKGTDLKGILSERDYARKIILAGRSSDTTTVNEIMVSDIPILNINDTIEQCSKIMTEKTLRYLPVFENNKLVNVISQSDIVKYTIESQKSLIEHLKEYMNSR